MLEKSLYNNRTTLKSTLVDDLGYGESLRYVGFDFETLTPRGRSPEPFELGYIILNSRFEILEQKQIFIMPPKEVEFTEFDRTQTGVSFSDLDGASDSPTVLSSLDRKLSSYKCVFFAQNASYDFNIFKRHFDVMGYSMTRPYVDTIKLAKRVMPDLPKYGLSHMAREFGLEIPDDRHRALADVELTLEVLRHLIHKCNLQSIDKLSQIIQYSDISGWCIPKQISLWD